VPKRLHFRRAHVKFQVRRSHVCYDLQRQASVHVTQLTKYALRGAFTVAEGHFVFRSKARELEGVDDKVAFGAKLAALAAYAVGLRGLKFNHGSQIRNDVALGAVAAMSVNEFHFVRRRHLGLRARCRTGLELSNASSCATMRETTWLVFEGIWSARTEKR